MVFWKDYALNRISQLETHVQNTQRELAELKALVANASEDGSNTQLCVNPPWNPPSNPPTNKSTKKKTKQQRRAEEQRIALARAKTWARKELDLPVPK